VSGFAMRVALIVSLVLVIGELHAQDSLNVRRVGHLGNLWDHADGVAVAGHYAYVATNASGLRVMDVQTLDFPEEVGHCLVPGGALGVAVSGHYVLVAAGESGLQIVDVAQPQIPRLVSALRTPGSAVCVVSVGSYAFIASFSEGVRVVDISDPLAPREVGSFAALNLVRSLCVAESYLYAADYDQGMVVLDISVPSMPVRVGAFHPEANWAYDMAATRDYVYLLDDYYGLHVLDVSDPRTPVQIGQCGVQNSTDVKVAGSVAYVTNERGLHMIDISAGGSGISDDPRRSVGGLHRGHDGIPGRRVARSARHQCGQSGISRGTGEL